MYGYVYLTTNLVNQKKYIGQHKSSVFDKKYKGSGKILKQAIVKYGAENFETIILEECETKESLDKAEINWIARMNAVESTTFYNMSGGGEGWGSQWANPEFRDFIINFLHNQKISEETKEKLSISVKKWYTEHPEEKLRISNQMRNLQVNGGYMKGRHHSEETKKKMSDSRRGKPHIITDLESFKKICSDHHADMSDEHNPMYGKSHSDEAKSIMSKKRTLHNLGCCWLNNGSIEKFVKDEIEIQLLLEQGFTKGRIKHKRNR